MPLGYLRQRHPGAAINDDLFPVAAATESVRRTRLVYERHGAADRLVHDVFEGGHQWHGTEALPFLDRWLGHEGTGPSD